MLLTCCVTEFSVLTDLDYYIEIYKTVNTWAFVWFCSNCLGMNFAARTNCNFKFARTAKIFNTKLTNRLKKIMSTFLSTFSNVCYVFIINALINVYCYFWTFNIPAPACGLPSNKKQ